MCIDIAFTIRLHTLCTHHIHTHAPACIYIYIHMHIYTYIYIDPFVANVHILKEVSSYPFSYKRLSRKYSNNYTYNMRLTHSINWNKHVYICTDDTIWIKKLIYLIEKANKTLLSSFPSFLPHVNNNNCTIIKRIEIF